MKRLSIVTPCFNEEMNVQVCRDAVRALFDGDLAGYDHEHIFCDNRSTDGTLSILKDMASRDKHVRIIVNARNFGIVPSMFNGLLAASGDAVVLLMADLQDPPEVIPQFVRRWEEGHRIVYGIREKREEGLLTRGMRNAYYRIVSRMSEYHIPVGACEFGLFDRSVVDILRRCDDHYPYLRGMIPYIGFESATVGFTWRTRRGGKSKGHLLHMVDVALNGLTYVNRVPLRLFLFAGLGLSVLSILYAAINFAWGLIFYQEVTSPGIVTLIVALFFFSGVQLFMLGVIAEYIGSIHRQVRRLPLVVEDERINFDA